MSPPPRAALEVSVSTPPPIADASMLEDKVPEWLKFSKTTTGLTMSLVLVFLSFSYQSLWHTDLWGHLSYGRSIVEAKTLPNTEPLLPLAKGVPFVDTAWLSQVVGYLAIERLGLTSMSFLYAAAVTAIAALLMIRNYQRSRSAGIALAGVVLWLWGCWQHLTIVRPQLAGMLCFSILLAIVTSRQRRSWHWVAVPMLFAVWANLHGSFLVGLLLLAGLAAGRAIDLGVRCGEFRAVQRDSHVRRYVLLLELAAAAVLLNPYGVRLYAEVLNVSNNANVAELVEWAPLQLRMSQGKATAVIALLLIVLYRLSPRRVTSAEVLLLFGFGAASLWSSRMLVWWVPLAITYGVMHASAVWHASFSPIERFVESPRSGRWTVITAGICWISFALTPFGGELTHGFPFQEGRGSRILATTVPPESLPEAASADEKSSAEKTGKGHEAKPNKPSKAKGLKLEKLVSAQTPLGVVEHLKKLAASKELPSGQTFNTFEWGDYLLWDGPKELQLFVASHIQYVPREIWNDYLAISGGASGWEEMLDRYGVNVIVLDEMTHDGLIRRLREGENWSLSYKDNVGVVFVRKKPV